MSMYIPASTSKFASSLPFCPAAGRAGRAAAKDNGAPLASGAARPAAKRGAPALARAAGPCRGPPHRLHTCTPLSQINAMASGGLARLAEVISNHQRAADEQALQVSTTRRKKADEACIGFIHTSLPGRTYQSEEAKDKSMSDVHRPIPLRQMPRCWQVPGQRCTLEQGQPSRRHCLKRQ